MWNIEQTGERERDRERVVYRAIYWLEEWDCVWDVLRQHSGWIIFLSVLPSIKCKHTHYRLHA